MTNQNAPVTPLVDFFNINLNQYTDLAPNGKTIQLTLSCEDVAIILATYDNGVANLGFKEMEKLDFAIATIKQALWG